jgi:glycosyltransferase involved in cell wall biosynthesis
MKKNIKIGIIQKWEDPTLNKGVFQRYLYTQLTYFLKRGYRINIMFPKNEGSEKSRIPILYKKYKHKIKISYFENIHISEKFQKMVRRKIVYHLIIDAIKKRNFSIKSFFKNTKFCFKTFFNFLKNPKISDFEDKIINCIGNIFSIDKKYTDFKYYSPSTTLYGKLKIFFAFWNYNHKSIFRKVEKDILNCDVLFVNYLCFVGNELLHKRPTILFTYDILSDQLKTEKKVFYNAFKRMERRRNLQANKLCNYIISATTIDRDFYSINKNKNFFTPPPVNLIKSSLPNYSEEFKLLFPNSLPFNQVFSKKNRICMFVGVKFDQNDKCVVTLKKISKLLTKDVYIVIAGTCSKKKYLYSKQMVGLGMIKENDLYHLYQRADIFLMPRLLNTGFAIKNIEALLFGKFLLGTKHALKGIGLTNRKNCIMEDNIDLWPAIISYYLHKDNKKLFNKIRTNIKLFSEKNLDFKKNLGIHEKLIKKCLLINN